MEIFPDTSTMELGPQLFLIVMYGYVLLKAADLIGEGCDTLFGIYGAGIVGGLVIPLLGAIPDAMMILMAGLGAGSKEEIQHQLNVGIGTLAGSTIMLLTLPFAMAIYLNARVYDPVTRKAGKILVTNKDGKDERQPAIPDHFSWTNNCATYLQQTKTTAKIMLLASSTYLIMQIPAFIYMYDGLLGKEVALDENKYALVGFIVCIIVLLMYCHHELTDDESHDMDERKRTYHSRFNDWLKSKELRENYITLGGSAERVFSRLDQDNDGYLDVDELVIGLRLLGLQVDPHQTRAYFAMIDQNNDNLVTLEEFEGFVENFMRKIHKEDYIKEKNPGLPSIAIIEKLMVFLESDAKSLDLDALNKHERHQLHYWINDHNDSIQGKKLPLVSYSSDLPHTNETGIRKVRVGKAVPQDKSSTKNSPMSNNRRGSFDAMKIQILFRTRHDLPRWANASNYLIDYCDNYQKNENKSDDLDSYGYDKLWDSLNLTNPNLMEFKECQIANQIFDLGMSDQALSLAFHSKDDDDDRRLDRNQFKSLMENLVEDDSASYQNSGTSNDYLDIPYSGKMSRTRSAQSVFMGTYQNDLEIQIGDLSIKPLADDEDVEGVESDGWCDEHEELSAIILLAIGTFLVTIFSDPMVDVLNETGKTLGCNPFYLSFCITPIASNATEVIGSMGFAAKKNNEGFSLTAKALYGAATMNATFCLAVFYGLIYFRDLEWNYSAEVLAILLVSLIVGIQGANNDTFKMWQAACIALLFPFALVVVYVLENVVGLN